MIMAYIDKIKSGKKTFYYLGKTIRVGENKWKKIRIKLSEKEPTREEVGKKLKELQLEEYNVYNKDYLDANKLEIIDDFKEVYNNHRKTIPKTVAEKEEADFLIRFTYNSNAIEGNRLTLRDTYLIIKEKQIPSGAPPKDYNEAINGREAFEFIKKYQGKLTTEFLEKLNGILTQNTGVVYPGRVRFFPVKIEGAEHAPPEPEEVRPLLKNLITFYYENKRKIPAKSKNLNERIEILWLIKSLQLYVFLINQQTNPCLLVLLNPLSLLCLPCIFFMSFTFHISLY